MKPLWKWTAAALLGAVMALTLVATGWAAPQEVTTNDNKVYVGEVTEIGGNVTITRIHPLYADKLLTLKKADVKSKKAFSLEAAREEFKKLKSAIKPENAAELVNLAEWALERNMTFDAEQILSEQAEKGNPEAKILLELLNNLKDTTKPDPTKTTKAVAKAGPTEPAALGAVAEPLSGKEKELDRQVKLIYLREFVSGERVTIRADRKVLPKVEKDKEDPYKPYVGFAAADDELLEYTRKMVAADDAFIDPLSFSTEPAAVRDWTRIIQPLLKRNCSTKTCHGVIGDGKAPVEKMAKFQLLTVGDVKPAVALGNFDYFRRYANGTLLRPGFPSESRILMYGLPKDVKKQMVGLPVEIEKHDTVRGWTESARDYGVLRDWIGKLRPVSFEKPTEMPKPDGAPDAKVGT